MHSFPTVFETRLLFELSNVRTAFKTSYHFTPYLLLPLLVSEYHSKSFLYKHSPHYRILLPLTVDPHFGWQYELLECALLASCGEEMAMELAQQSDLVKGLSDVACIVKNTRDVQRQTCLVHELQNLSSSLPPVFRLPLNPTLQCCDIDVEVLTSNYIDN